MGHTIINGVYYVTRKLHEKLKREHKDLNQDLHQLTAHYSEVKMSFEKCAEENKKLKDKLIKEISESINIQLALDASKEKNHYTTKEILMFYFAGALLGAALFAAICFSLSLKF